MGRSSISWGRNLACCNPKLTLNQIAPRCSYRQCHNSRKRTSLQSQYFLLKCCLVGFGQICSGPRKELLGLGSQAVQLGELGKYTKFHQHSTKKAENTSGYANNESEIGAGIESRLTWRSRWEDLVERRLTVHLKASKNGVGGRTRPNTVSRSWGRARLLTCFLGELTSSLGPGIIERLLVRSSCMKKEFVVLLAKFSGLWSVGSAVIPKESSSIMNHRVLARCRAHLLEMNKWNSWVGVSWWRNVDKCDAAVRGLEIIIVC